MTARRKICVVTGNRAEYGLLRWTMQEIRDDPALDLYLIVTGQHLEPRFGATARLIEDDGFAIDARVPIDLGVGSVAQSTAKALSGIAEALERLKPDIVLLLGDRFEVHAAATAAMIARVPIAHAHGGEATEGAIDEAIRHAVTKMAHLHFVSAEPYRRRVIQLGEAPERVFLVGAAGLDNIERLRFLDAATLEKEVGAALGCFLLVTYHPTTLMPAESVRGATALLAALDRFPGHRVLVTGTNADSGGAEIRALVEDYAKMHPARVVLRESLGQLLYLSALKAAAAVIGNSSSGILEAPYLGVPTVNLGDRQRGRLRAASVIDCVETEEAIAAAIARALDPAYRATLDPSATPYGRPGAARRIRDVLKTYPLDRILMKSFYDLKVSD
ncbi:MAG: UDP-N-acetylglucosamine 2-epimerase (hydrolyzing) [Alphaproteobacteria bacterium]|nr:UDP-N-acetylglucosamine 2-epimerase (hydrolyzing) [Alphaproteobacteria bacterium]